GERAEPCPRVRRRWTQHADKAVRAPIRSRHLYSACERVGIEQRKVFRGVGGSPLVAASQRPASPWSEQTRYVPLRSLGGRFLLPVGIRALGRATLARP